MTTKSILSARQLLPVLVMCGMMLLGVRLSFAQASQVDGQKLAQQRVSVVDEEAHHDVSPPVFLMAPVPQQTSQRVHAVKPIPRPPSNGVDPSGPVIDAPVRQSIATILAPAALANFDGIGNGFQGPAGVFSVNSAPSDVNGDVGPKHYVQIVNSDFAVFDKSGVAIFGPVATNMLWAGFGGGCQTNNDGDAVVLYDPIADRWVISQFSVSTTPYQQCVAVSQTPDPTGAYFRYSFSYGNTDFPDYPKMGVWPDAYYITFNMFTGTAFSGAQVCAYDRAKMLVGQAATQQCFNAGSNFGGMLPADLDGKRLPPAGAPNPLVALGANPNELAIWKFHVDWATPANSTFTGPTRLVAAAFSEACGGATCIPQPGTAQQLDSLSDRLMFRLAYRNFGDHQALVVNHSVTAGSSVGVRWYELRLDGFGNPSIFQQGTYAPDSNFRWMGSIAQDQNGNMALGFSLSGSAVHPAIHYTGRLAGDPAGTMTQGEGTIIDGPGSQTGSGLSRWGDYSMMAVDPSDDCTFWYTNQYIPANGEFNWRTRVGSFKFSGCPPGADDFSMSASPASLSIPRGRSGVSTISTTVTQGNAQSVNLSVSGVPPGATATLSPASVTAGGSSTLTVNAGTAAPGGYVLTVKGTGTSATYSTPVQVIITSTTTSLSVNMNPVLRRQFVIFTAQVAGGPIPTGTVTFMDGTKVIGTTTLDSAGVARLSTFFTTLGTHIITASYSGDSWNAPSISPPLEEEIDLRIDGPF